MFCYTMKTKKNEFGNFFLIFLFSLLVIETLQNFFFFLFFSKVYFWFHFLVNFQQYKIHCWKSYCKALGERNFTMYLKGTLCRVKMTLDFTFLERLLTNNKSLWSFLLLSISMFDLSKEHDHNCQHATSFLELNLLECLSLQQDQCWLQSHFNCIRDWHQDSQLVKQNAKKNKHGG